MRAANDRWRAFTSNWREVTRCAPRFHLDVSAGFICKAGARANMEDHRRWLESLPLNAKDFALITKLLAVIRMTEQAREMTVDLKKIIAAQREPRARNLFE
jgi:hypothetical protein